MIDFISWFSVITHYIVIPTMALLGIYFHQYRKSKGSMILSLGLIMLFLGFIIGFLFPQEFHTIEEAEETITTVGPPLTWFIDDLIISVSLIVSIFGFSTVVYEDKKQR